MGRRTRLLVPGGIYHVGCRAVRQLELVVTDRDRALILALLRQTLARFRWRCHAFCVLTSHLHLLIETEEANLSAGMHWFNSAYARTFNRRHGYSGHVFDRRFWSVFVDGEVQFATTARYIDLNPVRAGACSDPADYQWSSFRFTIGMARSSIVTTSTLLSLFGRDPSRAAIEYARFVREGVEAVVAPTSYP
jgi:REP element-mobilizing transposase RayT